MPAATKSKLKLYQMGLFEVTSHVDFSTEDKNNKTSQVLQ